jgi:hypothetical protein
MATLSTYQTKAEKQTVFTNSAFCDSEQDVRDWLADLDRGRFDGGGMAFRGLSRSSYKLYSSLQRNWIEQDLAASHPDHKALVERILDEAFRKGVSGTVLQNGERDDLAMLSYLQHHECPTPLLDFTSDIRVALFFASQEPRGVGNGSELDEYFAVYIFHPQVVKTMNAGLEKAWWAYSPGQHAEAARCFRSYEMNCLQDTLIFEPQWIQRVYGADVVNLDTSERFRRQSGLFAMNNTSDLPFPEAIHAFVDARTNDERERQSVRTWINSLNIHRDYVELVRTWLTTKQPPLTRDRLLPGQEAQQWARDIFDLVLKRTL